MSIKRNLFDFIVKKDALAWYLKTGNLGIRLESEAASTSQGEATMNFAAQQEGEACVLCADSDDDDGSDSMFGPFVSSTRHFCLLSSCSPSQSFWCGLFLRPLSKAFENAQLNEDIPKLMRSASFEVTEKPEFQDPLMISQMVLDFCIKNILPIYLASKRADRAANVPPSTP